MGIHWCIFVVVVVVVVVVQLFCIVLTVVQCATPIPPTRWPRCVHVWGGGGALLPHGRPECVALMRANEPEMLGALPPSPEPHCVEVAQGGGGRRRTERLQLSQVHIHVCT